MDWPVKVLILGVLAVLLWLLIVQTEKTSKVLFRTKTAGHVFFPTPLDSVSEDMLDGYEGRDSLSVELAVGTSDCMRAVFRFEDKARIEEIVLPELSDARTGTPALVSLKAFRLKQNELSELSFPILLDKREPFDLILKVGSGASSFPGKYQTRILLKTDSGSVTVPAKITLWPVTCTGVSEAASYENMVKVSPYASRLAGWMKKAEVVSSSVLPESAGRKDTLLEEEERAGREDGNLLELFRTRTEKRIATMEIGDTVNAEEVLSAVTSQLYEDETLFEEVPERLYAMRKLLVEDLLSPSGAVITLGEPVFDGGRYFYPVKVYAPHEKAVRLNGKAMEKTGIAGRANLYEGVVACEVGNTFFTVACGRDETRHLIAVMKPVIAEEEL